MLTILEHESNREASRPRVYQYRECGLDDVWLMGGFSLRVENGLECIQIDHQEELHKAIALSIINRGDKIAGRELRFLRLELGLTQEQLARLLGADAQSVARWEKGKTKAPGPADRLIRFLYLKRSEEDRDVMQFLDDLATSDRLTAGRHYFERAGSGWRRAA